MQLTKRNLIWHILFILFFLLIPSLHLAIAQSSKQPPPQHVLIVHSAYQGYPWTDSLNIGIHEAFDSSPVPVDLMFEYIDTKRNRDPHYFEQLRELWKIKYHNLPINLIIVCDNQAYDFVLQERSNLFRGIPIVFAAYIGYTPDMLDGKQHITGVIQETDIAATIDVALLLHPRTKKIVFVAPGAPPFRMVWLEGLKERYAKKVQLLTITAEKIDQIDKEIDSHGKDIVVIPLNSYQESNGTYFPFDQFVSHLSMEKPFPVYALWDIAIGRGVVGGKMVTGASQGSKASELALQILQGTPVSDVPVVTNSPNQYMFDWDAMQRFRLSENDLPEKTILINSPVSFYDENKTIVHISLVSVFALLLLILALIVAVIDLRRTKKNLLLSDKVLSESEARFRKMIEKSPLPMVVTDQAQHISFLNDKFTELFGYTLEDVNTADEWWSSAYPDLEYREKVQYSWLTAIEKASATGTDIEMQEWALTIKDGTQRECEFYMVPLQDQSLIVMNDISERKNAEGERKKLELRLQQAQKMEAIGTLAGGIAHDFNNLLAVILGYTDLAKEDAPPGTHFEKDLDEVTGAAIRAKDLVKQILAFSRETEVERFLIKIPPIIKECLLMLRSSIPTTINIIEDIDPQCGTIQADPSQVHQILMNLCTNAYHAMEGAGGTLSVALKTTYIKPDDKKNIFLLTPGEYIKCTVSDTGVGIGPDVMRKIFDPYFTTKEVGKGTGMGLAIIHGIMNEYGGAITVESQLGKGAAFHVYFPAVKEGALPTAKNQKDIPIGSERVLFIDDEAILADMGKDMLERLGYHVTVRYSSLEALETFQNTPDKFDLVITDQTMPGMTGADLARRILQIRPMVPIILCTGYSSIIDEDSTKGLGIKEYALKPITKADIAVLIRKVLDVP
ncbi:MAG: PAS domain S-box-containing protein [Desulforhopalus sp.]|jgi:PAS domain S-box-containing protein